MVKRITKEKKYPGIPSLDDFPVVKGAVDFLTSPIWDAPITTGLSFTADGCNITLEVSAVNRFGNFPTEPLRYRNPFCRERKPLRLPPNPVTENTTNTFNYPPLKGDINAVIGILSLNEQYQDGTLNENIFYNYNFSKVELVDFENPVNFGSNNDGVIVTLKFTSSYDFKNALSEDVEIGGAEYQFTYYIHKEAGTDERNQNLVIVNTTNVPSATERWVYRMFAPPEAGMGGFEVASVVLTEAGVKFYFPQLLNQVIFTNENSYGERNDLILRSQVDKRVESPIRDIEIRFNGNAGVDIGGAFYYHDTSRLSFRNFRNDVILLPSSLDLPISPPIPPNNMSCCPNVRENDELLRLILSRIGSPLNVEIRDFDEKTKGYQPRTENQQTLFKAAKINTDRVEVTNDIIGISEYPITAPLSIVEDYKDIFPEGFDLYSDLFADADTPIQLANLTQFINWQVEQESAVMGGWQQVISFEKDGKKDVIRLINVAETLRELILIQVGQNKDNSLIVDMCTRMLTELIQIKGNVIKGNYVLEDIQDYLDYPTKQKEASFPITITTPEEGKTLEENESVERLLKPSLMKVAYDDWTGDYSLHEKLLDLLQAAAMIRAVNSHSGEELANYGKFADGTPPPDGFGDWE